MSANVLIVEDSLTVRMDLADTFNRSGFVAFPCATAREARELISRRCVDVILLDVMLPDADGVEVLHTWRREGNNTPVLMLSSEAAIGERMRAYGVSANEFVPKPYDTVHLINVVRRLVTERAEPAPEMERSAEPTVLIIDDSATYRQELSAAVSAAGFRAITATSGEDGLRMLEVIRPAAVLVDGILPGISGPSVIRRMRLDSVLRSIPCLLLTAAHGVDAELEALDSGADGFVLKDGDVELVLAKLHALLRSTDVVPATVETRALTSKRILTVDDSVTYRRALASFLSAEGYEVVEAATGEEALALLAAQPVDCVLMDLEMPGLGGRETCKRMKESPELRSVPVVVLTGVEGRNSLLDGLAMGADDFIQKSAEFEVLKARVRAQIRRRQIEDETRQVQEQLLRSELRAAEAVAARKLAETKAALVDQLEEKNRELGQLAHVREVLAEKFRVANQELERAYKQQQETQAQLIQSAKLASLGELVAGVAHEINNPLAFALSHLETARRCLRSLEPTILPGLSDGETQQWAKAENRLGEMSLGLDRIRDLILKLRTFSRLDEGERKSVSLKECIDSVLVILKHRCGETILTADCGNVDELDCYPSLLNQALMNLVANALDAVGQGGIVSVQARSSGTLCTITVTDNGPGIPAEHRERVFEPFFTTKPVGAGTGLGLSMTYAIVRKHRGSLEIRDAHGGGTEVIMTIPTHSQETT
jgi:two-component system, NtrC family, sensor kinase